MSNPGGPAAVALLDGRPIAQIGILVEDLDRAIDAHAAVAARDRWHVVEPSGPRRGDHRYRGAPAEFRARLAFSLSSPEVELIQPLSVPSIYGEWITAHGHGIHHLAVIVDSVHEAMESMAGAGFATLQSAVRYGSAGDGGHAYFDTEHALGYVLEAIEHPSSVSQ